MRELTDKELQRFWHYVDRRGDNECWPWLRKGTGTAPMFCIDNTAVSALRIMYRLYYDEDVPEGKIPTSYLWSQRIRLLQPATSDSRQTRHTIRCMVESTGSLSTRQRYRIGGIGWIRRDGN